MATAVGFDNGLDVIVEGLCFGVLEERDNDVDNNDDNGAAASETVGCLGVDKLASGIEVKDDCDCVD